MVAPHNWQTHQHECKTYHARARGREVRERTHTTTTISTEIHSDIAFGTHSSPVLAHLQSIHVHQYAQHMQPICRVVESPRPCVPRTRSATSTQVRAPSRHQHQGTAEAHRSHGARSASVTPRRTTPSHPDARSRQLRHSASFGSTRLAGTESRTSCTTPERFANMSARCSPSAPLRHSNDSIASTDFTCATAKRGVRCRVPQ